MAINKKKKNTGWIIVATLLIFISAFGAYNFIWIRAYYYDIRYDHFKAGDKLYARDYIANNKKEISIVFYRLIRPITADDIDNLNIGDAKQNLAKQNLKKGNLTVIYTNKTISNNDLRKSKSGYIGTYIRKQLIVTHDHNGKSGISKYYQIKPNLNIITEGVYIDMMPDGYTYADNNLYISFLEATNTESFKASK